MWSLRSLSKQNVQRYMSASFFWHPFVLSLRQAKLSSPKPIVVVSVFVGGHLFFMGNRKLQTTTQQSPGQEDSCAARRRPRAHPRGCGFRGLGTCARASDGSGGGRRGRGGRDSVGETQAVHIYIYMRVYVCVCGFKRKTKRTTTLWGSPKKITPTWECGCERVKSTNYLLQVGFERKPKGKL